MATREPLALGAALVWLVATAGLAHGCGPAVFACEDSAGCAGAGSTGVCEADGWCSFPDASCAGGRRYGAHAGAGQAGTCVGDEGTTTSTTATTSPPNDPTVVSLEGTSTSSTSSDQGSSDGSSSGMTSQCGDGVIEAPEQCDAGPDNGGGGECRPDCLLNTCGDGYLGPREQCDGTPECAADCTFAAVCGDGRVEFIEECDDAVAVATSCAALGWVSGSLECVGCVLDTSECVGCGPDGCSNEPCNDTSECPAAELCAVFAPPGVCTAVCNVDQDCGVGVSCVNSLLFGPVCLVICEVDGDCPRGTDCFQFSNPRVCI